MVSPVAGSNLMNFYQGQTAVSLLTNSTSDGTGAGTDSTTLLNYLNAQAGITSDPASAAAANAPTAPWDSRYTKPAVDATVQNAVAGQDFVDPSSAKLDAPAGVNGADYKGLFALYQGLNTLNDLATTAAGTTSAGSGITQAQLQTAFTSGMAQVQSYLSNDPFKAFNVTAGKVAETSQSTVGIPDGAYQNYTTGIIGTGDQASALKALQGPVQFTITVASKYATTTVTRPDGTKTTTPATPPINVNIDLDGMGSRTRSITNVVNYINSQLVTAKISTKFAVANLGKANVTTQGPGGTSTTAATGDPQWGLTINGNVNEQVTLSAPTTGPAVYVGMTTGGASQFSSGATDADGTVTNQKTTATAEQLMKLQTDATIPLASGSTLPVGGVFAKPLPQGVTSIQSSATAPDGSVYVLADASGSVNSAPVPGTQGVALLKYDAAGKLQFTKILPGAQNATGYSMAIAADGSVAVAGTNTTAASTSSSGLPVASQTSAFVQVYDSTGSASWSQSVPTIGGASAASGVAFGADGSVYLSGATTGSVGNQIPQGSSDEFIQGFDKTGKATFTTQYGTKGAANSSAGMTIDTATGTLYTAGLENGKAIVRSFTLNSNPKKQPTPTAVRILGSATSVVGIGMANGQVVVAGNATTKTISAATIATPYAGVASGFVMSMDKSLTAQPSDTVSYLGMPGATQNATALTVSNGQAYVTGTLLNDPHSLAAPNATEGFVSGVDTTTGAISYSKTFAGANGQATPTAISVSNTGASVLDQLGLPSGAVNATTSSLITANTPIKPGSSFYVRTAPGSPQIQVTITNKDDLTSLTNKLNLALGGQGVASVVKVGANSQLKITPNTGGFVELDSTQASSSAAFSLQGSANTTDVLGALGLSAGVVRTVNTINGLTDVNQLREYGLNLPSNLSLGTTANAQHASNAIQAAMVAIKNAYQDLVSPPTRASEQAAAQQSNGGTVPTYLTNEISNYQAGLQRILANQSSNSSSSSSGIAGLFG